MTSRGPGVILDQERETKIMFMTVETTDGQVYVGEVEYSHDGRLVVRTGFRGRPIILDPADVVEVLPVNRRNPHVEMVGAR